jgi:hypothetical protein
MGKRKMAECLHLDAGGRRCRQEAAAGSVFCADHDPATGSAPESAGEALRRFLLRLVALGLLALFLIPLVLHAYQLLRELLN